MDDVFGATYAKNYDSSYSDKDYEAEADLIEQKAKSLLGRRPTSVMDLGCGTGNHAWALAKRGYDVVGIDRSPHMLEAARKKAAVNEVRVGPVFVEGDIRYVKYPSHFDLIVSMFAVLGYLSSNDDLLKALKVVASHLTEGGVFVFDVWYGPAVLNVKPSHRIKEVQQGDVKVIRESDGELDVSKQLCTVRSRVKKVKNSRVLEDVFEEHEMRFFFPRELELLLSSVGMELISISDFSNPNREPTLDSWNVLCVAQSKLHPKP